jgi:ATP-dependent DNA helicase RecG
MDENYFHEKKSLRILNGSSGLNELAKDCICFANARGGIIAIGIEDNADSPDSSQRIDPSMTDTIRKRISELTINVGVKVTIEEHINGGEWIRLEILPSATTIASTTDGHYYIRVSDHCKPVLPDELTRLFTDKPAFQWESKVVQRIETENADNLKLARFKSDIVNSDRVSDFVKNKSTQELLEYYQMSDGRYLTNLGVLWLGKRDQRSKLLYAPVVQFTKYDERGNKIKKLVWDDYEMNPRELIEDIWDKIPEFKEGIEISEGISGRRMLHYYHESVVRELLSNALVHRPYTTRGDIFINMFPDRIEIHNPGLLPMGVTSRNILHQSVKRNEHLCKVFYDLNLMEREGSGYDKMYEIQVSEAKHPPIVEERDDRTIVTVINHVVNPELILLIDTIKKEYQLSSREVICLGIIAQNKIMLATEFAREIQSQADNQMKSWLGRLLNLKIILSKGRTKGTEYFLNPKVIESTDFAKTNLKRIESYRLKELILTDLKDYPKSSISQIHERIGKEIPLRKVRSAVYDLTGKGAIIAIGIKKSRKYFIDKT